MIDVRKVHKPDGHTDLKIEFKIHWEIAVLIMIGLIGVIWWLK
ncbi:hypothetical protein [Limosilactobacillus equigenerosi]|nr:hypothetical protein [Limosilactobacillus equigenerosi]